MAEDKSHAADVYVPGDTEQFDRMAQASDDSKAKYIAQVKRFDHLANFLASRSKEGIIGEVLDSWTGKAVMRCEIMCILEILAEKGLIEPTDFMNKITDRMDRQLSLLQIEYKVILTPEGVISQEQLSS